MLPIRSEAADAELASAYSGLGQRWRWIGLIHGVDRVGSSWVGWVRFLCK